MMKTWLIAGTGLALIAGGVAVAQTPPAPPPGPPPAAAEGPPGGPPGGPEGGHHGHRGRWMEMMHGRHGPMRPPPMSKAAYFRLNKGDSSIGIKCADDEPTKACIDAASALLDKLAQMK